MRSFYAGDFARFLSSGNDEILGVMAKNNPFDLTPLQRNAWGAEIDILKNLLAEFGEFADNSTPRSENHEIRQIHENRVIFEYTIPRIGKRTDAVLLLRGIVFLLEFKIGERAYNAYDVEQVLDYALDLKNFHKESQGKIIAPLLICTHAPAKQNALNAYEDGILKPLLCNRENLKSIIENVLENFPNEAAIDSEKWQNSPYSPTPTIIEAAQTLYAKHSIEDISRSDSGAYNISLTTAKINEIIEHSKTCCKKSICFITGVPGAGKTLAGINIANERHKFEENEHAVFLSGNAPLVEVLQEALARDEMAKNAAKTLQNHAAKKIKKQDALRKVKSFIQIIHHYRDAYVKNADVPLEKVAIFDEAQRSWTREQIASFMARKKGIADFAQSESEFLISTLDRHEDWAVIVCLVGGGQEINTGEAGLGEWFSALKRSFSHWEVYVSNAITDDEYTRGASFADLTAGLKVRTDGHLHLATSIRSFRSENVSAFIKALLDNDAAGASGILASLDKYPIVLTRDLAAAKAWVRRKARGSERYGLLASSGALRLKAEGIFAKNEISAANYFLNGKDDVRSSFFLEDCASEFAVQGLELDYCIVAWDADFRYEGTGFTYNNFSGTKWQKIASEANKIYLKNAYRVLLTRARQGMVIFIPRGDAADKTRLPEFYDKTYEYLRKIGIREI